MIEHDLTPPSQLLLLRNFFNILLYTDSYAVSSGTNTSFELFFDAANGFPIDGDYFTLKINNVDHLFTFKDTPDDSGYQLPTIVGYTLLTYPDVLLGAFLQNYIIDDLFTVQVLVTSDILLTFTSIEQTLINVSFIGPFDGANTATNTLSFQNYAAGTSDVFLENYSMNLSLYAKQAPIAAPTLDFEHVADYYQYPKLEGPPFPAYRARININEDLLQFMEKNYRDYIIYALPFTANNYRMDGVATEFYYKFYEAYGFPSQKKKIQKSATYHALLGGLGFFDYAELYYYPSPLFKNLEYSLHHYDTQYIHKMQPCYACFLADRKDYRIGGYRHEAWQVDIIAHFTDGTNTVVTNYYTHDISLFTDTQWYAFCYPIDFNNLSLDSITPPGEQIYYYEIYIKADNGDTLFYRKNIILDPASYLTPLMYRNSLGGWDTFMIATPKEYSLDIKGGEETKQQLVQGFTWENSYQYHHREYSQSTPKARESIKAFLGYHRIEDYDTIKELLMSDHVYIPDLVLNRFLPINIDRKNVRLEAEDEFVNNIPIEFSPAHDYINFQNSDWSKSVI